MSETLPLFVLHTLGFAGFLWLGLYALAHGDRGRVATLTGLTALATACFFCLGGVLIALHGAPATVTVQRVMWWANVLPVALWLHLSLTLNPRAFALRRPMLAPGVIYGAALLGSFTSLINNYGTLPVAAGPAYALYAAYLLAGTGVALVNLARLWRWTRPPRALADARSAVATGTIQRAGSPASSAVQAAERAMVGAVEARAGLATGAREAPGVTEPGGEAPGMEAQLLVAGALFFLLGGGYLVSSCCCTLPGPSCPLTFCCWPG